MKKIYLVLGVLVLVILITGAYKKVGIPNLFPKSISQEEAKSKTIDFVKNNLVQPGTNVAVKSITEESGLYKIILTVGTQDITSYLTKDGTEFFPQAMNIADATKKAAANSTAANQPPQEVTKSDTPEINLFVMSYCPYGTQMEKGILPVLDTLKDKIKFNLEFVSYSMHNNLATNDRKELDENMRQYCIEKNEPTKLDAYLSCFLKKGQGTETNCMTTASVNATQVASCMTQTDSQFNVTKDFNDQSTYQGNFPIFEVNKDDNTKYGVQGSPTLVINGAVATADNRDSASLLKTICSAFNNPPAECQAQLSSAAPSPGFGDGTGSSGGNASCGN